jgi:lipopolysaccharide biosynthesis protein
MRNAAARVIALYLPQFHPIPQNDEWWGKGFTEWTNVAKAKQLFPGHYQPHVPADLGFYDLRVSETRAAQADLARAYGIEAFCYWHYWFAGGRLLERPFGDVLESGEPDFPFCLAWANQSWTGIWHGAPDRVLQEQTYPGREDHIAHFRWLVRAFGDDRYVRVDGRPLFVIFRPTELPDPRGFAALWQSLARAEGFGGIHLVAYIDEPTWNPEQHGFDAVILETFSGAARAIRRSFGRRIRQRLRHRPRSFGLVPNPFAPVPTIYEYREVLPGRILEAAGDSHEFYPCILPNWDNTPRSGLDGIVLHDSTPERFRGHVRAALEHVECLPSDRRLVFIKSWNEWAEGNHLEPDLAFGTGYLEAVRDEVLGQEV